MKLADMFYLYDCLKRGYSKAEIKTSIYLHYANRGIKTRNLHTDTFNKYQKLMRMYIDEFKYKELVSGIKQ